jgi:hypothetical protein
MFVDAYRQASYYLTPIIRNNQMKQAITTSHHTTSDGNTRITVKCWSGKLTVNYNQGLCSEINHWNAAKALILKMGWVSADFSGNWLCGETPEATGYVYVYDDGDDKYTRYVYDDSV